MTQPTIILDINIQNFKYLTQTNWIFFFLEKYKTYFLFKKKKNIVFRDNKVWKKFFLKFFFFDAPVTNAFNKKNKKTYFLKYFYYLYKFFFNINFLKKEKIYTKLKYSRVPQYDIVSGGSAALLAGFLGFLIAEKFGFELLDSGDFYFLFMYFVFFFFICRIFLKLFFNENRSNFDYSFISSKWFFGFYLIFFAILKKYLFR